MSAEIIAKALGNARQIGLYWRCNCPHCGKDTLSIEDDLSIEDGITVSCDFACSFAYIKTNLKLRGLLDNGSEFSAIGWGNGISAPAPSLPDTFRPDEQPNLQNTSLRIKNVKEWISYDIKPNNPIIPGLFDRGDKVVIIGQSKTRKSFFAMQLGFCISTARSFLGFPALEAQKVLLIQFEIKADRYHARLKRMASHLQINPSDIKDFIVLNGRGLSAIQELISTEVEINKPDLLILDPFYKLMTGDENKIEDVKPVLQFFDSLAEKFQCAIVYVHHDKKGASGDQQLTDRGSGSGILARDFDSAIFLTPHRSDENCLVMEFVTRNYAPIAPMVINWLEGSFGVSEALPQKQTKKSMAKEPTVKLEQYVSIAKKLIESEIGSNAGFMPMPVFKAKLTGNGIAHRMLSAVIEQLASEDLIVLESRKARKGESSKYVIFKNTVLTEKLPF